MYQILIFGLETNPGGVERFICNYCNHFDKNRFHIDFLCNTYEKVAYEDELSEMGGHIYHICARSKHYLKYRKELTAFFEGHANEYNAIWVNVCSLANVDYLIWAKKYGIKRRIIHSHNSQAMGKSVREILHKYYKGQIGKIATDFWACSKDAAKYFYGDCPNFKVEIIPNAIEVEQYFFDLKKRNDYRKKLGWRECFVIGNVGRLHFQKNQTFLIDIFAEIHCREKGARLLFIGQGEDEQLLRDKVEKLGLSDFVFFAGVQNDIQGWLSAMDLFVFPSKFEGAPIAAIEAQANGLPVLASENVMNSDVKVNENFMYLRLDISATIWAKQIVELSLLGRMAQEKVLYNFKTSKYEISHAVGDVEKIFIGK